MDRDLWLLWIDALRLVGWALEDADLLSGMDEFMREWHADLLEYGFGRGYVT